MNLFYRKTSNCLSSAEVEQEIVQAVKDAEKKEKESKKSIKKTLGSNMKKLIVTVMVLGCIGCQYGDDATVTSPTEFDCTTVASSKEVQKYEQITIIYSEYGSKKSHTGRVKDHDEFTVSFYDGLVVDRADIEVYVKACRCE